MKKSTLSILNFSQSQVAQTRLKVIDFHNKYGAKATIDAYSVSKATIYRWKKRLKDAGGRLESLIPDSREPKRKRQMMTHPLIIKFIKDLRKQYPRLGKEKIKPLLDEFCQEKKIPSISISTIGKVIKRYNLYLKTRRVYHDPNYKYSKAKLKYKTKIKRLSKVVGFGYIEIDTIVKFTCGIKIYILNAIDVNLKFCFSYGYTRLNSKKLKLILLRN